MTGVQNPDLLPIGMDSQDPSAIRVQPIATLTPPSPIVKVHDTKYYFMPIPNASMHRPDGTRIAFLFGVFETNLKADQEYLDNEIERGHTYLRYAKPEEIQVANMKRDPRGTIKKEVHQEVMHGLEAEIEAEVRRRLNAHGIDVIVGSTEASNLDGAKIGEVSALDRLKELSEAGKEKGIRSGSATVVMKSEAAPLKGIGNTDQIKALTAESGR